VIRILNIKKELYSCLLNTPRWSIELSITSLHRLIGFVRKWVKKRSTRRLQSSFWRRQERKRRMSYRLCTSEIRWFSGRIYDLSRADWCHQNVYEGSFPFITETPQSGIKTRVYEPGFYSEVHIWSGAPILGRRKHID